MRRLLQLRIVRWEVKGIFVLGVVLVGWAFGALGTVLHASFLWGGVIGSIVQLGAVLFCARIFRGRGEPIEPARAWWRMTAWPRLSRVAGFLALAAVLFGAIYAVQMGMGSVPARADMTAGDSVSSVLFFGILSFLYLNSAVRLKREGLAPPPKADVPGLSKKASIR